MNLEEINQWRRENQIEYDNDGMAGRSIEWLIAEVERLKPFEHEYICKKCGLRQNSNMETPNF